MIAFASTGSATIRRSSSAARSRSSAATRARGSGWLVVEGDESDRSVAALRPEIAVLLNVDLDVHSPSRVARDELETMFEVVARAAPHVVRAE